MYRPASLFATNYIVRNVFSNEATTHSSACTYKEESKLETRWRFYE